jgi:hypothetical protein
MLRKHGEKIQMSGIWLMNHFSAPHATGTTTRRHRPSLPDRLWLPVLCAPGPGAARAGRGGDGYAPARKRPPMRLRLLAAAAAVTALPLILGGAAASASSTAHAARTMQATAAVASAAQAGRPGAPARASSGGYANDCYFEISEDPCYILANYAESSNGCWYWAEGYYHGSTLSTECSADVYIWVSNGNSSDGISLGQIETGDGYYWNYSNGNIGIDGYSTDANEQWGMVPTDDGSWCIKNLKVGMGGGCVYFYAYDGDPAIISSPNQPGSELFFETS